MGPEDPADGSTASSSRMENSSPSKGSSISCAFGEKSRIFFGVRSSRAVSWLDSDNLALRGPLRCSPTYPRSCGMFRSWIDRFVGLQQRVRCDAVAVSAMPILNRLIRRSSSNDDDSGGRFASARPSHLEWRQSPGSSLSTKIGG